MPPVLAWSDPVSLGDHASTRNTQEEVDVEVLLSELVVQLAVELSMLATESCCTLLVTIVSGATPTVQQAMATMILTTSSGLPSAV